MSRRDRRISQPVRARCEFRKVTTCSPEGQLQAAIALALAHVSLGKQYRADIAYRHASRGTLIPDVRALARVPADVGRFPVARRALFSGPARILAKRRPAHSSQWAMTFKYFRTRTAPRFPRYCAREKLADVRWMRNRARRSASQTGLACPRKVACPRDVSAMLGQAGQRIPRLRKSASGDFITRYRFDGPQL